MPTTHTHYFTDDERAAAAQWSAALPLGLRIGTFDRDEETGMECVAVLDRTGDGIYLLSRFEGSSPGSVTLDRFGGISAKAASMKGALARVFEWEQDHLAKLPSGAARRRQKGQRR